MEEEARKAVHTFVDESTGERWYIAGDDVQLCIQPDKRMRLYALGDVLAVEADDLMHAFDLCRLVLHPEIAKIWVTHLVEQKPDPFYELWLKGGNINES